MTEQEKLYPIDNVIGEEDCKKIQENEKIEDFKLNVLKRILNDAY